MVCYRLPIPDISKPGFFRNTALRLRAAGAFAVLSAAGGIYNVFLFWFGHGCRDDPEKLAKGLDAILVK